MHITRLLLMSIVACHIMGTGICSDENDKPKFVVRVHSTKPDIPTEDYDAISALIEQHNVPICNYDCIRPYDIERCRNDIIKSLHTIESQEERAEVLSLDGLFTRQRDENTANTISAIATVQKDERQTVLNYLNSNPMTKDSEYRTIYIRYFSDISASEVAELVHRHGLSFPWNSSLIKTIRTISPERRDELLCAFSKQFNDRERGCLMSKFQHTSISEIEEILSLPHLFGEYYDTYSRYRINLIEVFLEIPAPCRRIVWDKVLQTGCRYNKERTKMIYSRWGVHYEDDLYWARMLSFAKYRTSDHQKRAGEFLAVIREARK